METRSRAISRVAADGMDPFGALLILVAWPSATMWRTHREISLAKWSAVDAAGRRPLCERLTPRMWFCGWALKPIVASLAVFALWIDHGDVISEGFDICAASLALAMGMQLLHGVWPLIMFSSGSLRAPALAAFLACVHLAMAGASASLCLAQAWTPGLLFVVYFAQQLWETAALIQIVAQSVDSVTTGVNSGVETPKRAE